ncbi:hypothetical protein B0H13DRAFT_913239 [Mycena leptocephala]|nr:hypothetical protein B0H13DRAFT_913239 [Mycena leptocephala]
MSGDYFNGHPSPKTTSRRPSFPNKGPYVSLSGPGHPPAPRQSRRTPSLPKSTAPRRPLGDLPVPPQNSEFRDVPYLRSPASVKDPKDLFTPPTNQNPLIPSSRPIPQPDTGTPRTPPPLDSRVPPPVTPQRPAVPASAAASSPSPIVPSNLIASSDPLPVYLALPVVQPAAKGTDTKPTTSLDKPLHTLCDPRPPRRLCPVQSQCHCPRKLPWSEGVDLLSETEGGLYH